MRIGRTLEDPAAPWPSIEPEDWVREQKHQERELADLREARQSSLAWLRTLRNPDWTRAHHHAEFGALRAGDLFAAWAAHDVLHLRQLANVRLAFLHSVAEPYSIRYAQP